VPPYSSRKNGGEYSSASHDEGCGKEREEGEEPGGKGILGRKETKTHAGREGKRRGGNGSFASVPKKKELGTESIATAFQSSTDKKREKERRSKRETRRQKGGGGKGVMATGEGVARSLTR